MSDPDDFSLEELPGKPISSRSTEGYATRDKPVQQNVASTTPQTPDKQGGPQPPQSTRSLKQMFNQFKSKFLHFVDKYSYILIPLTFAILIFFFTLLISMHKQVSLPLLPFALFLLGLAVMQGALLYYVSTLSNTSSKETYWNLTVIIGFAVFLVVGTLEVFGLGAGVFLLILLLIIGTVLARRSIYLVQEGSIDIVKVFGKYVRTLQPGLHLLMPWEKPGGPLSTKETNWKSPGQVVKIDQGYEVQIVAAILYQLDPDRAYIAVLNVVDWETSLREKFVTTLKNVFRELTIADIKSWRQGTQAKTAVDITTIDASTKTPLGRINDTIKTRVQQDVDSWGVKVQKVVIQDITLIPNLAPRPYPIRPINPALGPTGGGNQAGAQPQQGPIPPDQQTILPLQPPYGSGYTLTSPPEIEALKEAFEAVRTGQVRDPQTIREIAARFEAHSYDPYVDFDPVHAADILYRRAWLYEQINDQKARAPDEPTSLRTTEEYPSQEFRSVAYPPMEPLPLKLLPSHPVQNIASPLHVPTIASQQPEKIQTHLPLLNDSVATTPPISKETLQSPLVQNTTPLHILQPSVPQTATPIGEENKAVTLFFCYARKDETLLNNLKAQLQPLQRQSVIKVWYDRDISAGAEWEHEIDEQLSKAEVILLLVSPSFLASDYCYSKEMQKAIERHERNEVRAIPIILRPCDWQDTPLGKLQALPKDGKPITTWAIRDNAYLDTARGIRKAVEDLTSKHSK